MTKPYVLFLDFDGVVNILDRDQRENPAEGNKFAYIGCTAERRPYAEYPIVWNPDVVDALNELNEDPEIAVVWLTDWQKAHDGLDNIKETLGLGPFEATEVARTSGWWKTASRHYYLHDNEPTRTVWVDDNVFSSSGTNDREYYVNPDEGITLEEIEELKHWLKTGEIKTEENDGI